LVTDPFDAVAPSASSSASSSAGEALSFGAAALVNVILGEERPVIRRTGWLAPPVLVLVAAVLAWRAQVVAEQTERARTQECSQYLRITIPLPGYLTPLTWLALVMTLVGTVAGGLYLFLGHRRVPARATTTSAMTTVGGLIVLVYVLVILHVLEVTAVVPVGGCGG
jgi:hypothetical protein